MDIFRLLLNFCGSLKAISREFNFTDGTGSHGYLWKKTKLSHRNLTSIPRRSTLASYSTLLPPSRTQYKSSDKKSQVKNFRGNLISWMPKFPREFNFGEKSKIAKSAKKTLFKVKLEFAKISSFSKTGVQ